MIPLTACSEDEPVQELKRDALVIETSGEFSYRFNVELATTQDELAQGLMNRTELPKDEGMLFYFKNPRERSFWMKNTLIPLDLIFIKVGGVIHYIHENARPKDLTPIPSKGPVLAVLEINGGLASKLGIRKGDKVRHKLLSPENEKELKKFFN